MRYAYEDVYHSMLKGNKKVGIAICPLQNHDGNYYPSIKLSEALPGMRWASNVCGIREKMESNGAMNRIRSN